MSSLKHIQKRKKWRISFWLFIIAATVVAAEQLVPAASVSASKEVIGSAVFSPPPNIADIQQEVRVIKNLMYDEAKNSFLDIYHPANTTEPLPVILFIHGGGYVGGSKDSRQDYAMALANAGYMVANIDYALAPDQIYPGPILQANAALAYLNEHASKFGGDMRRLFIGGDSAGAQISSQLAAVISNEELAKAMNVQPAVQNEQLRGALLLCGLFNMETVKATGFPNIESFLNAYTGTEQFEAFDRISELSTVQHITPDYPPVFITAGDGDPFASQSEELVNVLKSHHVAVDPVFFNESGKELRHEFQYALDTIDAQETLEKTISFLAINSN
ncbi:alpha/beta hydrolase [Planococcus sp. YIM B11945]|uniref:alpha/beta hydrolase n=1 Tax=Planococcus sp. YIM B11945 TaxID=3435410 RepID=UPI003D7E4F2F